MSANGVCVPPIEPPVAASPVATPRLFEKKWATAPTAGVNMRELARPQRMEYVRMKCHSSILQLVHSSQKAEMLE